MIVIEACQVVLWLLSRRVDNHPQFQSGGTLYRCVCDAQLCVHASRRPSVLWRALQPALTTRPPGHHHVSRVCSRSIPPATKATGGLPYNGATPPPRPCCEKGVQLYSSTCADGCGTLRRCRRACARAFRRCRITPQSQYRRSFATPASAHDDDERPRGAAQPRVRGGWGARAPHAAAEPVRSPGRSRRSRTGSQRCTCRGAPSAP